MKKNLSIYLFLFVICSAFAQQNTNYSQFMLNDYGFNPAIAGSNKKFSILAGRRSQWAGFKYSPETNFANFTMSLGRKKRAKNYWHGVGIYVEQDKLGLSTTFIGHASYAIHLKLNAQYTIGFGIAAGMRQSSITTAFITQNDPVIITKPTTITTPNFTPGLYLYSKKVIAGVSVRNLYKNTLDQGDKSIGTTGSKILPNTYLMFGRKIISNNYDFIFVPSIQVQTTFTSIPSAQLNLMTYYRKRVGLGISYRSQDAICAIIQFRIGDDIVFGFAYDFTTSRLGQASGSNSTEVMFGFHSVMSSSNYAQQKGANACPKFEL